MFVPSDETVASAVRIQAPELRTFSEHPKPMSAIPSHSAPDRQKPSRTPSDSADRVRRMLQDIDMPLDGLPTNRVPEADRRLAAARRERERRIEQQQRNDLSRARRAASKVFGVKPSKSSRRSERRSGTRKSTRQPPAPPAEKAKPVEPPPEKPKIHKIDD